MANTPQAKKRIRRNANRAVIIGYGMVGQGLYIHSIHIITIYVA